MEGPRPKILLIDDDIMSCKLVSKFFSELYEISYILDPCLALETLKQFQPELIILDIEMPVKNGIQVLKEIREAHSSIELPVIMLSASSDEQVIIDALELGANDYITKPIVPKVADARLHTQLNLKRFYKKSMQNQELEVIQSMVITYNHEINNPLTVALGNIMKIKKEHKDHPAILKAEEALLRIASITQKISELVDHCDQKEIYIDGKSKYKL